MLPIVKICRTANSVKGIALFLFVRLKFYGFNVYMYATKNDFENEYPRNI